MVLGKPPPGQFPPDVLPIKFPPPPPVSCPRSITTWPNFPLVNCPSVNFHLVKFPNPTPNPNPDPGGNSPGGNLPGGI